MKDSLGRELKEGQLVLVPEGLVGTVRQFLGDSFKPLVVTVELVDLQGEKDFIGFIESELLILDLTSLTYLVNRGVQKSYSYVPLLKFSSSEEIERARFLICSDFYSHLWPRTLDHRIRELLEYKHYDCSLILQIRSTQLLNFLVAEILQEGIAVEVISEIPRDVYTFDLIKLLLQMYTGFGITHDDFDGIIDLTHASPESYQVLENNLSSLFVRLISTLGTYQKRKKDNLNVHGFPDSRGH